MLTILHGENTIDSRNRLVEIIDRAKEKGAVVARLDAKKLEVPQLEEKLVKSDLFGNQRLVVVEGLHSLRRSKKKNTLIKLVAESQVDICLWEERELTKNMVKKLDADRVKQFKIATSIFDWLDSIGPRHKVKQLKLMQQALKANDEYMCFAMLSRQIRLLIKAKDGGRIKGPPFVVRKVKKQARRFSLSQLLKTHYRLHQIDLKLKTSTNSLELRELLEWLIINL